MPVKIRKLKDGKCRVYNAGKVTAKRTSCEKAEKQVKLLRGIEHGMVLRKRKK
jgi:hypothetical protein